MLTLPRFLFSKRALDGTLYKMVQHRRDHIVNDERLEPPECVIEEVCI